MTDYYSSHPQFFVGVDCIIFGLKDGKLNILLTHRAFEPEMGKWSLMGGFVERDESVDDAAARVLRQLTGLDNVYMHQVGAFGRIDRDPGERVVSVAYFALLNANEADSELLRARGAQWTPVDELPELGFDHPEMIEKAREVMRRKFVTEPLAFELLPELFTLTQLQTLYELVMAQPLDKRNFRKRIAEFSCIEPTGQIDKTGSRRGARLYHYNPAASADTFSFFKI